MDVGSALDLAFANLAFFFAVIVIRLAFANEGIRSFRLNLAPRGLLLYIEGAAAAVSSWLIRGLFMILTGHGSVALHAPGRSFWIALGCSALGYLPVTLFEESLFRGYIQDRLAKKRGVTMAVALQALIFGPLHALSWPAFAGKAIKVAMVTVFGLAMGTAARDGRSLMWGVGFHHWWNISEDLIEGHLSPVQLTAPGGLTGSIYACWVGFAVAVVTLGLTRLRFTGRLAPARRTAGAADSLCLTSAEAGHPNAEMLPVNAEEGAL